MRRFEIGEMVVYGGGVGAIGSLLEYQHLTADAHHTDEYNADQDKILHLQQQNSAINLLEHEGVISIGSQQLASNNREIETIAKNEPHQSSQFMYAAGEAGSVALGALVFGVASYNLLKRVPYIHRLTTQR